jgi:hypothetical protein
MASSQLGREGTIMTLESTAADKTPGAANDALILKGLKRDSLRRGEIPQWLRLCVSGVLLTFVALTIIGIVRTYTPVPRADDWDDSFDFFINISRGHWQAWFAQYAEHRPVLPRVLYWADIKFFHGRFIFELLAGLSFGIGAWAILVWVARALINNSAVRLMIVATVTLLLTSWMQIPNFGIPINAPAWFMLIFFMLATLVATALSKHNQLAFCAALLCGVAAAGTTAAGIIALPLSAVLAACIGFGKSRVVAIILLAGAVLVAYFTDYVRPEISGSPLAASADPFAIIHYVLAYIGNVGFYIVFVALAGLDLASKLVSHGQSLNLDKFSDHPVAFAAGLAFAQIFALGLIALFSVLGWQWLRSGRDPLRGALIMFVVFVFGTAVGTSLGRSSVFGIEGGIAARYTTLTLFALACLVILAARYMTLRQTVVLFMSAALLLLPRQLTAVRSRAAEHALLENAEGDRTSRYGGGLEYPLSSKSRDCE